MLLFNAQHPNRKPHVQMQMFLLHFSNSWRTVDAIAKQTQREVMHSKQQAIEFAEEETDLNWGDEQADEHDEPAAVGNAERATIGDGCPICMHALPADAFALPCTHAFCMDCLQRWLTTNHHTCPTCRATVPDDVTVQLLQGTSMPLIFDLGRRLATTDMETLRPNLDLLMLSLRENAQLHPLSSLLSETSCLVLHAIGLDASDLTFKPYLDHMAMPNDHGMTRSLGRRVTALCAINANGLRIHRTAVDADACSPIKDALQDARLCNTCALWLDQHGVELPPKVLAHETMLKPDDCWLVQTRDSKCMAAFLSDEEASVHFRAIPHEDDLDPELEFPLSWKWMEEEGLADKSITHTPILGFLLNDLLAIVSDYARQPLPKVLAALFFWSVLCANAANPDILLAVRALDTAVVQAARGRLCNYDSFHWMSGIEKRLPFLEREKHFGSICTTDSIPLSFETFNTTQLKKASKSATAYLMHAYMTMHRATFRHVVHSGTLIHIDSASRAKLLTGAYELGILLNHPTFSEVFDAVANKIDKESKIYMHPIAKARLHLAKRALSSS